MTRRRQSAVEYAIRYAAVKASLQADKDEKILRGFEATEGKTARHRKRSNDFRGRAELN